MNRRRTAVLGAAGYIGQHFAARLQDHPWFEPPLLVGSPRTRGQPVADHWVLPDEPSEALARQRFMVAGPPALAKAGVEIAFSALPSGSAGSIERSLARHGIAVFSNAADLRGAPGVPLLIPEVNAPHLAMLKTRGASHALIVNNPNCSATGLAVSLRPLLDILRPRVVHVSTYQSLSGAGYPGVSSLAITDNVVPYIEGEEEKIAQETQQLLGPIRRGVPRPRALPILAHCARVATREGHLEAVTLECAGRPSLPEILSAWRQFDPLAGMDLPSAPHPPIRVRREPDRPQPLRDRWGGDRPASRGMAVSVGRVRWKAPYLRFYLLSHNAVRGGAGGSILNAELAVHLGWIPG